MVQDPVNWIDIAGFEPYPPPPASVPGGPWEWTPDPNNSRGGTYRGQNGEHKDTHH